MAQSNKSIWISSENELSLRSIDSTYTPSSSQVLVKAKFSGINPADIKHGLHLGLNDYPSGYEYSGEVIATGPEAKFSIGDIVFGHNLVGKNKPIYHGAHQDILIGEHFVTKVPPNMPAQDAACVSIMVQTAADALFNQLELPGGHVLNEDAGSAGPILIWGGSSNVGAAAIQLAKAAGISPILTTASTKNHELLKSLGATECFDYKDTDVVAQIKDVLQKNGGQNLQAILDSIASHGPRSSTDLCEECAGNDTKVAATLPQPAKPRWKMVLATRNAAFVLPKPGGGIMTVDANPAWQSKIDQALKWCSENYGKSNGFVVPNVRVVGGGEEAIEAMKFVAEGKSSMEKVVISRPL